MGLMSALNLGLKAEDYGFVWCDSLDDYLSRYELEVEVDEAYVARVKSVYKEMLSYYKYNGATREDYASLSALLRFELGLVDLSSNICKVYVLGDVVLYNILSEGIIIIRYGSVVLGYLEIYGNNQLYYNIYNNSICYSLSNKVLWCLNDRETRELLNEIE